MVVKKDDAPPAFVFKFDMHCDCQGCADKIKKAVRGVVDFEVDMSANKLTVIGKVDPAKVRHDLAEKYKTKVEIVSPQPENDAAAGNEKLDNKMRETECIKAKKELQEEKGLSQLLKPECDEIRQSAMRQVEEMERLVNTLHASTETAERECAKLKRMLEEEKKLVRRLTLEKDDEVQLAKRRQIEEIGQELALARKDAKLARQDAELARKDADATQNELTKVKREVKEKEKLIKRLKLETQDTRQVAVIQVEDINKALKEAQNEAEHARNEAEHARNDANIAQDCAICLTNEKDMALGCGHMTCEECGKTLSMCPICREDITIRIKLFRG